MLYSVGYFCVALYTCIHRTNFVLLFAHLSLFSFSYRTRLTIVASAPEGFEFTIRTPGTPARWHQYDEELCAVWGKLAVAVCENTMAEREGGTADADGEKSREEREDAVCDIILEVGNFWNHG